MVSLRWHHSWKDGSPFGKFLGAKGCNDDLSEGMQHLRQQAFSVALPPRLTLDPPLTSFAISCVDCAAKRDFSLASLALQQLTSFGKNQYC